MQAKIIKLMILILILVGGYFVVASYEENIGSQLPENESNILGEQVEGYVYEWWDSDYYYSNNIEIKNISPEMELNNDLWVEVFLSDKLSGELANSNAIQVVYKFDNTYSRIPFNSDFENRKLSFQIEKNIAKSDDNYWIYYETNAQEEEYEATGILVDSSLYMTNVSEKTTNPVFGAPNREWILKGTNKFNDNTKFKYSLQVHSRLDVAQNPICRIVETGQEFEMEKNKENEYAIEIDTLEIEAGTYNVISEIQTVNGEVINSPVSLINISYPLYVIWSMDWEGYNSSDKTLELMENLSEKNDMPISHFWNPRIYLPSAMNQQRANILTEWIQKRDEKGDEIGLHLHMFFDMVKAAGVTPITEPHWAGRGTGSDVPGYLYDSDEFTKILNWSKQKFIEKELGDPKSYRQGGWMLDSKMMQVLDDTGFLVESSGREQFTLGKDIVTIIDMDENNEPIEPYEVIEQYAVSGKWDLSAITKPYFPSKVDINLSTAPVHGIFEFPNNGADSWRHSTSDLIRRFDINYEKVPLQEAQTLTYITHPHEIQVDIQKLEPTFDHIGENLFSEDDGPVLYVTFEEAYQDYTGKIY